MTGVQTCALPISAPAAGRGRGACDPRTIRRAVRRRSLSRSRLSRPAQKASSRGALGQEGRLDPRSRGEGRGWNRPAASPRPARRRRAHHPLVDRPWYRTVDRRDVPDLPAAAARRVAGRGLWHSQRHALAYGLRKLPTPKQLDMVGERFRPYRTVAAWYCWQAVREQRKLGR